MSQACTSDLNQLSHNINQLEISTLFLKSPFPSPLGPLRPAAHLLQQAHGWQPQMPRGQRGDHCADGHHVARKHQLLLPARQGLAARTTGPGDGKGIGDQKGREKCWDIDIIYMIF